LFLSSFENRFSSTDVDTSRRDVADSCGIPPVLEDFDELRHGCSLRLRSKAMPKANISNWVKTRQVMSLTGRTARRYNGKLRFKPEGEL